MSAYCTEEDVRLRFGDRNVMLWGDLDNTKDLQRIQQRVARAIEDASADVDSAMFGGPYVFPIISPIVVPLQVRRIAVELAGWYLYSARGMLHDEQEDARLAAVKRQAMDDLKLIVTGVVKLPLVSATRVPGIVKDGDNGNPCRTGCTCPEEVTSRFS